MDCGKLIELLNEYEENRPMELPRQYRRKEMPTFKGGLVAVSEYDDEMEDNSDLLVISKFNGFIKWLVENNKIDLEKLLNIQNEYFRLQIGNDNYNSENYFVDGLLMLLAISNNPIDFLIEILK